MKEQSHLPPPFSVAAELRALEAKVNTYIDAGTLDATGVLLQPKTPAPSTKPVKTGSVKKGPADAVLARRSLLGIFERQIADGLPRDAHITGQVGGKPIIVRAQVGELDWTDDEITIVHQKGAVLVQRTRLAVPIVRNIKALSKTGVETIHFKVTWIVKQPSHSGKDGGLDPRSSTFCHMRMAARWRFCCRQHAARPGKALQRPAWQQEKEGPAMPEESDRKG